jgi:hypothetical protein
VIDPVTAISFAIRRLSERASCDMKAVGPLTVALFYLEWRKQDGAG